MMTSKVWTVDQRLSLTKFNVDKEPHIKVNTEICRRCKVKPCVKACPAGLYTIGDDGELHYNYEGCLECGTCRVICPLGAIEWSFPRGGFGVWYKYG